MSRSISAVLLVLGIVAVGLAAFPPAAFAEAASSSTETKRAIPTKESIQAKLDNGDYAEAEADYLDYANLWQEDDAALLASIESQILLEQFEAGDKDAFVALVQGGDVNASNALRAMLQADKVNLNDEQLGAALVGLALQHEPLDEGIFLNLLTANKQNVMAKLIEAAGETADPNLLPALRITAGDANVANSVVLARALIKLGASDELRERYLRHMQIPMTGIKERSALMLAQGGNLDAWPAVKEMLEQKQPAYYPLALSVLGALPTQETRPFIKAALAGTDAEKIAALQSINALPAIDADEILQTLAVTPNSSQAVRLAALEQLGRRSTEEAADALRTIAVSLPDQNSAVKAAAIRAIAQNSLLYDDNVRGMIRMQLLGDDKQVQLAARMALLKYASNAGF